MKEVVRGVCDPPREVSRKKNFGRPDDCDETPSITIAHKKTGGNIEIKNARDRRKSNVKAKREKGFGTDGRGRPPKGGREKSGRKTELMGDLGVLG